MSKIYKAPTLSLPRDQKIVRHIARNHLSTPQVIASLFFGGNRDAARHVLARLVRDGLLCRYKLERTTYYYRLGEKSASLFGFRNRTSAIGPSRLPYELACLGFFSTPPRKTRLLPHELERRFPWFSHRYIHNAHFIENDCLGSVRVFFRGRIGERTVEKLERQLYDYKASSNEFKGLIDDGRYCFALILASDFQAEAVERAAMENKFSGKLITFVEPYLERFV